MRVYIDADGCPVVEETVKICKEKHIDCIILCDSAHNIKCDGAQVITVSKGADSVDFALVNMIEKKSVVVTQDYGLAAMCLAKSAIVINQDGLLYTKDNIDGLLFYRYEAKKARSVNKRYSHIPKRTAEQDKSFEKKLREILSEA